MFAEYCPFIAIVYSCPSPRARPKGIGLAYVDMRDGSVQVKRHGVLKSLSKDIVKYSSSINGRHKHISIPLCLPEIPL